MAKTTKKGSTTSGATSSQTKSPNLGSAAPSSAPPSSDGGKNSWSPSNSAKVATKISSKNNDALAGSAPAQGFPPSASGLSGSSSHQVSNTAKNDTRPNNQPTTNYVVDKKIPQAVQATMAQVPQPTLVPSAPANGGPNVTVEIRRAPESLDSAGKVDPKNLGRDVIIFYNHDTGEAFQVRVQTVSNARDGRRGTIAPGSITLLNDAPGTQMPQPDTVMTIIQGQTLGGGRLNERGQAVYPDGSTSAPYRLHRDLNDYAKPGLKNLPTSAGCFTFTGETLSMIHKRLAAWGVERGATIPGLVIQEQRR